jgi:hypothetical protein
MILWEPPGSLSLSVPVNWKRSSGLLLFVDPSVSLIESRWFDIRAPGGRKKNFRGSCSSKLSKALGDYPELRLVNVGRCSSSTSSRISNLNVDFIYARSLPTQNWDAGNGVWG